MKRAVIVWAGLLYLLLVLAEAIKTGLTFAGWVILLVLIAWALKWLLNWHPK